MKFFVGCHQPADAKNLGDVCISINRIRGRKSAFEVGQWIMDSGAFTEISTHGRYRQSVEQYAEDARRWVGNGNLLAVVAQDFMCEPFILQKTGLTIADHQRLTIERYDALLAQCLPVHIMPVLQGFAPSDYACHVRQYGERLRPGMWVGVGSVCKRQGNPVLTARVLAAILDVRPDLRLHGFGVKISSLVHPAVRRRLLHCRLDGLVISRAKARAQCQPMARGGRICRKSSAKQLSRRLVATGHFRLGRHAFGAGIGGLAS